MTNESADLNDSALGQSSLPSELFAISHLTARQVHSTSDNHTIEQLPLRKLQFRDGALAAVHWSWIGLASCAIHAFRAGA